MKISYNWLKWYIPEVLIPEKLEDIFNYHLCEMESSEKLLNDDIVFDLKILPNRAHDLLSHQGVARELASLLNIKFVDPTSKYKIPESKSTKLIKEIKSSKCRRYMGRIVRNVKVEASPKWVVDHLASIGQRSINNIVDATNIVMFDCGQPAHVFDLKKVKDLKLQVRNAKNGEKIILLGGTEKVLNKSMMIIADDYGNALDIAGIKGGAYAELKNDTTDIVLECANFDPVSVRKTAQALNIVTDAKKRFENDLSPELAEYGMTELSALVYEMCPNAIFEDVVDVYPQKQEVRKLTFSADKISKILGLDVSVNEVEDILKRYNFDFIPPDKGDERGLFQITVPPLRLDLTIEEDMAEEIGRILGYDKVKGKIPKIDFIPKQNKTYMKISWARNKLLQEGYSEVMNSSFRDTGQVSVLASASDKNFLRANLSDGLHDSWSLNNKMLPLLGLKGIDDLKIFEIGTIWDPKEKMHVAYFTSANDVGLVEVSLDEFCKDMPKDFSLEPTTYNPEIKFKMWSLYPFVVRDIAVWVREGENPEKLKKLLKENATNLLIKDPEIFDSFTKNGKTSYAFRLVFQSFERTLTDAEVNDIMTNITNKIKEKPGWQVR